MRIDRITLRTIGLRLREPFRISSGVTTERRILLVFLDGDGVQGAGECVAGEAPNYSSETLTTATWVIREHLAPAILGVEWDSAAELVPVLERAAKGHRMAKAALEMAAWDAEARTRDVSLATLLGGEKTAVPTGVSIGIQDDRERLLDRIASHLDEGYQRIKLKIEPGRDFDVLEAVRGRFPDTPLTVDANAAYGAADIARLAELDQFGLVLVEQPFPEDELLLHAELQERMTTPVCLDESVTSPARCREAIALQAGRVVNIKPGRVGGLAASVEIHDLCRAAEIPVWCGGMLESGIGRAHNVALASLPNMKLPGDTSASRRYWERDIVTPEFELDPDGTVRVPTGPGIGVEIDEDFIASIELEREDLR